MSLLNHRMRSTDKDLLAIQKKLGNIVYPQLDQSQLDRLADKSQAKLSTRIVTEKFGKELVQRAVAQAQHGPRQMAKMYTLTLKVGCRNIPTAKGAVKFNCTVQFVFAHVIGRGGDAETCLYGAKEAYRKHLGNELRDADSLLRRSFMRKVEVEPVNPQDAETRRDYSDLCDEAKERFRIWFSTGIRATDGKVKKLFFEKVQHEEERFTVKCSKCGQRKPDLDFFTKEGMSTECADCRPDEVPEVDELDELVEDQAADAQEDAETSLCEACKGNVSPGKTCYACGGKGNARDPEQRCEKCFAAPGIECDEFCPVRGPMSVAPDDEEDEEEEDDDEDAEDDE